MNTEYIYTNKYVIFKGNEYLSRGIYLIKKVTIKDHGVKNKVAEFTLHGEKGYTTVIINNCNIMKLESMMLNKEDLVKYPEYFV